MLQRFSILKDLVKCRSISGRELILLCLLFVSLSFNLYNISWGSFSIPYIDTLGEEVYDVQEIEIRKGDTLYNLLSDSGLDKIIVHEVSNALTASYPHDSLKVCDKIFIYHNANASELQEKQMPVKIELVSKLQKVVLYFCERISCPPNSKNDKYYVEVSDIPLQTKNNLVTGVVNNSIYSAATNAGASNAAIMRFIKLFSYDIDFQRDIRSGNKFSILYEYKHTPEGRVIEGADILYASLTVGDKTKSIYRYQFGDGRADYYEKDGSSVRKALLKTPINGVRISSGYGKRKHPVLGYTRMHRGLDYAAPKGTPIYSAGDGVIVSLKRAKGGYGRYIKVRHNSKYSTLYAHMSKFKAGMKVGKRVEQGEVIGYVGSSGMATGPHLHYEVICNGKKVNPAKVKFPKVPNLNKKHMQDFNKQCTEIDDIIAKSSV